MVKHKGKITNPFFLRYLARLTAIIQQRGAVDEVEREVLRMNETGVSRDDTNVEQQAIKRVQRYMTEN